MPLLWYGLSLGSRAHSLASRAWTGFQASARPWLGVLNRAQPVQCTWWLATQRGRHMQRQRAFYIDPFEEIGAVATSLRSTFARFWSVLLLGIHHI